jgi:hypothetical protein
MIVSERLGPDCDWSIDSPVRASEPSTRMLLPVNRLPLLDRARSVSGETPSWVWALIRNRTRESASQPAIARATHLSTRPGVIGRLSRGGRGSSPSRFRESLRRSASRSPPRASGLRRAR